MGREAADLIIRNGRWVCVQSGEIIPNTDVAVKSERIAFVGSDAAHTIGPQTRVIDAEDCYLVPGLLDAHMHVESTMLTVTEFVRAALPHGTTGAFVDPHEIANVFGLKGVRLMLDEAAGQPIHIWVQVPSCVPSAPGLETPGATIEPDDVAEALTWPGVIGLGEVMNFQGVFMGDEKMHAEMAATRAAGKVIGGHYASPDLGLPFHGYAAGGAEDDHEGVTQEDAVARVRQGMKAILRYGSGWKDVAEQARAITEMRLDSRRFLLCNDDVHAATLAHEGHMDRVVRYAIAQGLPPMTVIQMATLNTAEHFGVSREVGMIAPGRFADMLIVRDLAQFEVSTVMARGQLAAQDGRLSLKWNGFVYPDWARQSVHIPRSLSAEDFRLTVPMAGEGVVTANIIGVIENQAPTRHLRQEVRVANGDIQLADGLAKVALVERHRGSGQVQVGLVSGFGFDTPCAAASTVAHDCHHLIVVGTSETDMALAANELARVGGGQVVARRGEIIGRVELPIAGLMSNETARVVAQKAATVLDGFRACGCRIQNPNMQLSLLALVVIPELRISDLGLVNVNQFALMPVLETAL